MTDDAELEQIRQRKRVEMLNQRHTSPSPRPTTVVNITSIEQFNQLVNTYKDHLIIVDVWAPWCGPCRSFAPIFESLQRDFQDRKALFVKLDSDRFPDVAQQFEVSGIPTTLFIVGNKLVYRQVGVVPKAQFAQLIQTMVERIEAV